MKDSWFGYNSDLGLFYMELDKELLVEFFKLWAKKQGRTEESHYLELAKKAGCGYIVFRNPGGGKNERKI